MGKQHLHLDDTCQFDTPGTERHAVYSDDRILDVEFVQKAKEAVLMPRRSYGAETGWQYPTRIQGSARYRGRIDRQGAITKPSEAELAISVFLKRIRKIPGVSVVRTHGGKNLVDRSILIEVQELRSAAANEVYTLRGELLRDHPDARLDVRVSAVRHGDTEY